MIEEFIEDWHKQMRGELEGGIDAILDDDCVFYSPIVFTPQKGKELTKLYLGAAGNSFSDGAELSSLESPSSNFKYTKEVCNGMHAILEFEATVDGKYMNGVDIITFNEAGKIVEFKVMMRPLQAINMIHEKMKIMLEKMQG